MGKKILAVLLSTALLFCAFRFDVVDVHAADNDTNEEIAEEIVETTLASEDTIDLSEEPIEIEIENEHETDEEPATDTAGDTADVGPVISMPENDESIVDIPEEEVIDTSTNDVSENEVLEIPSEPKAFCDVQRKGSVEIIIDAPAGVFPEGTIAIITELTDAGTVKSIEEAVSEELSDTQTITEIKAYDITMFDANGHEVQPDLSFGSVSVTFKNIDTLEALNDASKDIEVFHVEDSFNNAESMDASVSVQEVSFEAEHFSTYAVVSIEDNTADSSKVIDDKVLLKSMNVTVVDSKGNSKPLSATGDKISLSDTIHVEYIFNEPLVINPVNSKIDGYHVKAGEHYKLPSIPKVCAKPSGFSIDVKSADKKLGVITFDSDGNAVLEIDSSFGEMVEAKKALAGFDLSLNLNKADNGDKEEYELEFGDNKYTVKVSDFMAQPPKVTKSASTIDADGNVTWTVTVTNDAKPIDYADGYTIKDTFSEGQSYVLDSLKVVGGEAITPTASGSSITWNYKDNTASKATQFEYKTHIDFVALTKDENKNATVSKEISNNVEVTAPKGTDYDPLSISYKAKSTVSKAVDKWIDKSCTPVDENGKATWTIVIKNNGFTFKNVVLHDTIKADSGVEITMGPVTVVDAGGNNVAFTEKTTSKSHDIKFTDNMAGDAVYTVTYETTIEDYDTYLKDNHSVPSNKAWLTYEYDAKGNGEWTGVVGPGIDVNFKGDGVMSKAAIEKTEAGIDRVNHTMDWLVEINNNKQSLTEVSVSDKIPDKHTFVEVKDVKIDGAAATEGSDYTVDSTDPKNIKVIFNDNVKKKKASFVITTQLDDSQNMIWASNAKAEYTNVATLSSAGNKDVSDDAKQEFVSEVIKKTAGDYNYNTHIIPYTITVNQNKMPMGKVIVKDPLDSRLEYVDGSSNVTDTVYDASKNTLTFTFDNLDDTQVITFNAKVKDGDTFLNNGEFTIENNASLVSDKYDKETKVLANTKIKNTVIAKKGSRNKEVINYTVELNVANQDLYRGGVEEVVIEDKIGASLVLDEDSVKLYEAAVSADGKLTKATLVDTAEKRFDYSTPKTIMQVVVPKSGANKAYILEYTAKMLKAKANDFSNNVVLKGYGDNSKNTSDVEYQEKDFTDVDFSKYVYYISGLKDENNHTIDISGAHFELRDPSRGDRLIDEADTDENGELMFVGALEENHEYLLKETYVPDGYVIPDNLKDGVLVYTKGKGYAVALKEKDNNIVYNSKPSREVDFSLLDNRDKKTDLTKATEKPGKITVYNGTKEVWNSDSTTPFKAVYGIEYTVKESSDPYGYNGDSDTGYKFVIDEATQKLTLKTTSSNVSLSGDKITMYDSKKPSIDIKVNDVSESIGKSLKGAKFVLKKGTENFKTWESDGDLKEVTLFEGDYTLSRTDAPLGFLNESKVLKFSVKKNALGELEIETTENNDSLEITGNKIVVPEKTDSAQEVTVDTSTPRRGSVDLSKLTGLSLLPVTYTDGKETGVSDTPVWSETDGTPLKLQPQVEYVLSATDENGKKVLYKMVVDESGNLKTETYVAPRKSTSARPSSSNSSSHSGSSSNSSSSNSAPANTDKTVTTNTTNGNRTLAKTSGFIGTVVGYAVGVLMIVGGILMISVRRKKNK